MCAGHVLVLGVDSVIKVHNRMAIMAISRHGLIPRIMHQAVGPVSDREEGCRWSGECRWLKPREPLWREGALYANISHFFSPQSAWFFVLFPLQNESIFHYRTRADATLEPTRPCNLHKLQVNSRVRESRTQHLYGNYLKRTGPTEWLHRLPVIEENLRAGLGAFQVASPPDTAAPLWGEGRGVGKGRVIEGVTCTACKQFLQSNRAVLVLWSLLQLTVFGNAGNVHR